MTLIAALQAALSLCSYSATSEMITWLDKLRTCHHKRLLTLESLYVLLHRCSYKQDPPLRHQIREIMEAPNMAFSVKLNDATSLGKDMTPKVTRTTCQTLLTTFVNKGWLHLSSKHDASYSLSVRSLHELDGYLAQEFEDIVNECKCADCDEFVSLVSAPATLSNSVELDLGMSQGVGCKNSQCSTKMHLACFKRARRTTPSCPQCRTSVYNL